MSDIQTRRRFLQTSAAGTALATLEAFRALSPVSAADTRVTPDVVDGNLEPLVQLIFDTPREKCAPMVVEQLRGGLPYRQLLAALFVAALRNGHRHQVYVMHSVHQLSLDARVEERLLPLFWALDSFKQNASTQRDRYFRPLTKALPPAERAVEDLHAGMREWDAERTELALLGLARDRGPRQALEFLWHYGARDWQRAGHKAICVANSWRVLETIGWQHTELVLRLANDTLFDGDDARHPQMGEQSYQPNQERVARTLEQLPKSWAATDGERSATLELLACLRAGQVDEACELASVQLIPGRVRAGAIWDAVHLAAAELLWRCTGSLGVHPLHANTSANALHFAFRTSTEPATRYLILLQAVGWVAAFTRIEHEKKTLPDVRLLDIAPEKLPADPDAQIRTLRQLVLLKAESGDPHRFKFPVAVFEDCPLLSPQWRPYQLAGTGRLLNRYSADQPDSQAVQQARDALR